MAGLSVNMALVWLVVMVIFLVVEAAVPGLVSLWFAIGALAALIAAMFGAPSWLQLLWFFLVSIATLLATRPLAKKYINSRTQPTNADMHIGRECIVTEDIDNIRAQGAVRSGSMVWTARSADDGVKFSVGDVVTVVAIEGVKLIVK